MGENIVALWVYVDDIFIASNKTVPIEDLKKYFSSHFKLKDLGELKYFLGLEIAKSKHGISSLSQRKYTLSCWNTMVIWEQNQVVHLWR